jgi:hypothetical protein
MALRLKLIVNAVLKWIGILASAALVLGLYAWIANQISLNAEEREIARWQYTSAKEHCDTIIVTPSGATKRLQRKGCRWTYLANGREYTAAIPDYETFGEPREVTSVWYRKESPAELSLGRCGTEYVSARAGVQGGKWLAGVGLIIMLAAFSLKRVNV